MKRLSATLAFFALAAATQAESLALVFYDKDCPQQFAVLNGSREALGDLSLRFGKDLSIENFTPQEERIDADAQSKALHDAQKNGAKGAILFAANGDKTRLIKTIEELQSQNFPIAIIGRDIDSTKVLCSVLRDDKKFQDTLRKSYPQKAHRENFKIIFAVMGENEARVPKEEAFKLMPPNVGKENIEAVSEGFETLFYSCRSFGALQKKFGEEWYYWDNYGVVILDERTLADTQPLAADSDRSFVFSPQTSPILSEYLKRSDIQLCLADDYFGYGYITSVKLLEKVFENRNPQKKFEYLAPLAYTPKDLKKFNEDWINFLK